MNYRTLFLTSALLSSLAAPAFPQINQGSIKKTPELQQVYGGKKKFSFDFSSKKGESNVRWEANHQELVKDDYAILEGDVKVYYQDVIVKGDKITYNRKTKDVEAQGNVIVDQGARRLSADRAVFNLETKTGTLFSAKASFEPSLYFTGDTIEKLGEDTYRLSNGVFTSCDIDNPAWSFHLKRGTVVVDDYARLRDVSFRAHRVPLFFTPYLIWPTKRERSQGFLIPKVGFSSHFGSFLGAAYFIPVGDSYDATIEADAYSNGVKGVGLNQLRYAPSEKTRGRILAYAVDDAEASPSGDRVKWRYEVQHRTDDLPGGFRFVVDARDFSDLEFFRRFERKFEINTISTVYSSAYLTKNDPNYSLNIRTERRKNFLSGTSTQVFEQTPALEFRAYPHRVGASPLYYSVESSLSHLRTGGVGVPAADYYRADVFPTFSLQLRTPSWISVRPQLSLRETYYSETLDTSAAGSTLTTTANAASRSYAQGEVEVVGPSFSRIFARDIGGFTKFKHVIEPRVRYVYTTDVKDQNRFIRFDAVDSPFLPIVRDSVEYSLTQRIIGKGSGPNASAREILSFSLRQSASLSQPFNQQIATLNQGKFTPITASLHVNPYQTLSLDANATIGNESHQLDQASLSANLIGKDSQRYLAVRWFSTFDSQRPTSSGPPLSIPGASQFQFRTGSPILANKLRADVSMTYDATRSKFLEQRYLFGYFASCYNVTLEYRDLAVPTVSRDYLISINLTNVGTFVDLRGSLDRFF
ncbi:MAG TPA: LPS assembly protein LptD [Thermoanaerobaculia bacterium]|nr:LPS assembly protein LptD [Thermoanaerobaculia bacterium]